MKTEKLKEIVNKLNNNLPDDSMFGFGYTYTPFWESIDLFYMSNTIPLWNSEEGEDECTYTSILGKLQKVTIELMQISLLSKLMENIFEINLEDTRDKS